MEVLEFLERRPDEESEVGRPSVPERLSNEWLEPGRLAHTLQLALPAYDLLAFARTDPQLARPDSWFVFAPFSLEKDRPLPEALPEPHPGANCAGAMLRPESRVRTSAPFSCNRRPTPDPIVP